MGANRAAWAETIRAPIRNHPRAWAYCTSKARKRVAPANRRAAKTESTGRWHMARAIEEDGYVCWVFAGDLDEYSRNWLDRKPDGAVAMLAATGLPRNLYKVVRTAGSVRRIEFPLWGSVIEVFSSKDDGQLQKARGGRLKALVIDECQKMTRVITLLTEIVGPAGSDFRAEIWAQGTPGEEIGSFFHRASMGQIAGWEVHQFFSWDNPHFGSSFEARYQRAVVESIEEYRDEGDVTPEQMEYIRGLDEAGIAEIPRHPIGKTLPEKVQREYFGLWVHDTEVKVYAVQATGDRCYWADYAPGWTAAARGESTLADLLDAPRAWADRVRQLPLTKIHGKDAPKPWTMVLPVDLGFYPDPTALTPLLWSPWDERMFELDSAKAWRLGEDHQREVLEAWVDAWLRLDVIVHGRKVQTRIQAAVIDSSGGEASSVTDSWERHLQARFSVKVVAAEKYISSKDRQIWLVNQEIRKGLIQFLRHSPIDLEARELEYKTDRRGRVTIDKTRQIIMADGRKVTPGDHCLDALRYGWFWSAHVGGQDRHKAQETPEERLARSIEEGEMGKRRRR